MDLSHGRYEQLDIAGDAPLTTQFVLEDHAVRHSYHHFAKIKTALQLESATFWLPLVARRGQMVVVCNEGVVMHCHLFFALRDCRD